jgi:hypothetical protein
MKARPAFTLIELVLAMAGTTLLLLGVTSTIIVASRAAYNPEQPQSALARSRSIAQTIADDLAQATSLVRGTSNLVEFTVADRDDDGSDDTIRYEWSGTLGDGIYRSINGDPTLLATDIASLSFTYSTTSENATVVGDPAEGPEQLLYDFEDAALSNVPISTTSWLAMTFAPTLPSDATAWSITRLSFEAKQDGAATGTLTIKFRSSLSVLTSLLGTAIDVNESSLPVNYGWTTVPVSGVTGLSPSASISISFETASQAANSARLWYCDSCEADAVAYRSASSTAGSTWTSYSDGALNIRVYGTVRRPARTPTTLTRLATVGVSVTSFDSSQSAAQASASVSARPIVASGVLSAAFPPAGAEHADRALAVRDP